MFRNCVYAAFYVYKKSNFLSVWRLVMVVMWLLMTMLKRILLFLCESYYLYFDFLFLMSFSCASRTSVAPDDQVYLEDLPSPRPNTHGKGRTSESGVGIWQSNRGKSMDLSSNTRLQVEVSVDQATSAFSKTLGLKSGSGNIFLYSPFLFHHIYAC